MGESSEFNNLTYDEIVDRFLSGDISREESEALMNERFPEGLPAATAAASSDHCRASSGDTYGVIEYSPTDSTLEYSISGDTLHIADINSGQEGQGGCSYLLFKAEEKARKSNVSFLELEVWETNPALQKYQGKGFSEVKREYPEYGDGAKILMQKKVDEFKQQT